MQAKKLIASLMAAGLLSSAIAVPVTTGLAADPEAAQEGAAVSVGPLSGVTEAAPPDFNADGIVCAKPDSVLTEIPENVSVETSAVPISDLAPEDGGSAVPISDEPDATGSAVPISDEPDAAEPSEGADTTSSAAASSEPSATAPTTLPEVTLADLTKVAEYLAGDTELTPEEMTEYDLNGTGTVTLTDLTQLAAIYAAEENTPSEGTLPEADPQYATSRIMGTVTSVEADENTVYVKEISPDAVDDVGAIISEDTIIIDCQTGEKKTLADLSEGDKVQAYLSMAMMPSLPPRASCYALITNLPEEMGMADYVRVGDMNKLDNGGVVVLNQNADLWVTIPADLTIEVYGDENATASVDEIQDGTRLIVWYDLVLESYPAQTTALRCMIVPVQTEPQPSEAPTESAPAESTPAEGSADDSTPTESAPSQE